MFLKQSLQMSRQYLEYMTNQCWWFLHWSIPCAELSAHSILTLPQSMQIEPGLSCEGPDSIWIYWFNQLRVPYIVWSPTGLHWLNSWDSACAAKAKNTGEKRMENLLEHKGNFLKNINHSSKKIILTGHPFRMMHTGIQDLIYNLPIPSICFP